MLQGKLLCIIAEIWWAALQGVHALTPSPFALRAYLRERAENGAGISSLRLTVAALRKVQALVGVEPTANDQVVTDTIRGLARQTCALTAEARTVYLTPASVEALGAIRPTGAHGAASVFGLSAPSISRRIRAAVAVAGLGQGFSGHSGRVGMCRRMAAAGAPTHEIMAQGRWKNGAHGRGLYTLGRGRTRREVAGVISPAGQCACVGPHALPDNWASQTDRPGTAREMEVYTGAAEGRIASHLKFGLDTVQRKEAKG